MWAALLHERLALAHTEAVLLVDDRHGERAEGDVGLDQGVRPDDQRQLAAGQLLQSVRPPACRGRAAEQGGADGLGAQQPLDASRSAARRASRSAPSAPPGGRARRRAASRGAPRPSCREPTSPISSRCIGRSSARSASIAAIARRWSPVGLKGSDCSSQRALRAPAPRRAPPRPMRGCGPGGGAGTEAAPAEAPRTPAGAARLEITLGRGGSASPPARRRGRAAPR